MSWLFIFTFIKHAQEVPSQGRRHTKDVITMVPVVPLFSTEYRKGNTGSFSIIKIGQKKKWIKSVTTDIWHGQTQNNHQ